MEAVQKTVVTEAVGVFDRYDDLFETIEDLGTHGFGRHQISVRGSEDAVKEQFGYEAVHARQLEDSPAAPRSHPISADELAVAQGVLVGAGIYLGAAVGIIMTGGLGSENAIIVLVAASILGGVIGAGLAALLGSHYRKFFMKQAAQGGLVLWVATNDAATSAQAESILKKHGAHDVHLHNIALAA